MQLLLKVCNILRERVLCALTGVILLLVGMPFEVAAAEDPDPSGDTILIYNSVKMRIYGGGMELRLPL